MADTARSVASDKLDAVLLKGGPVAKALLRRYHRTVLWRLRTGRRSAAADTRQTVAELTGRKIAPADWEKPARGPRRCRACNGAGVTP
jgi:hypothetical protein